MTNRPGAPRLLVTGASGYLGRVLARRAANAGWAVTGTWHTHRPVPAADIEWVHLDVRNAHAVARVVAEARPHAVVHTAYVQGGADLFEVTAGGAEIVAHRASEAAAALIVVSTDVVFDGTIEAPARYPEQQAPRPLSDYGRAKAHAEVAVASAHPGALVVRTSLIYGGPDGPRSPHEQVVLDTLEGTANWRFHTDEWRCPVQVDDLAEALVVLAAQLVDAGEPGVVVPGRGRVLHLAGSDGVTRAQFARLVASSAGLDPAAVPVGPLVDDDRPANVMLDSGAALAAGLHLRGVFSALAGRE